jgi:phytoene dehydrogenase-like protein
MQEHEVIVVGAGLAGLACALDLAATGRDVVVLEAADAVGGRIRTDRVDGLLLDRGFQLLNPAYPALKDLVDLDALDLRRFGAGAVVCIDGERHVLADPRRSPSDVGAAFDRSTGTLWEKARLAAYVGRTAVGSGASLKQRPDGPYGATLTRSGMSGRLRRSVLEPFLAGVLGEDRQESSRVFVDLLLRTFARGTPSVPAAGMQALPDQLAARLPPGVLRVGRSVDHVGDRQVTSEGGVIGARAVVIATDPTTAGRLLGRPAPMMRGLTTYYHHLPSSPASRPFLHLDGDRSGPVVNSAVMSDVAPTYAEQGALLASTVLGAHDDARTLTEATQQLGRMYGVPIEVSTHVATYAIPNALVAMQPGLSLRQEVDLGGGLFVCGDHRDTASIQGAIVSGRRTAAAVVRSLS